MSLLWSLLPNALLPIPLKSIPEFLQGYVRRLLHPNSKTRPRQLERLRRQMLEQFG